MGLISRQTISENVGLLLWVLCLQSVNVVNQPNIYDATAILDKDGERLMLNRISMMQPIIFVWTCAVEYEEDGKDEMSEWDGETW